MPTADPPVPKRIRDRLKKRLAREFGPSRVRTLPEGPASVDQIPIHSLLTILFSAEIAERDARYEVFGLSGEGTL